MRTFDPRNDWTSVVVVTPPPVRVFAAAVFGKPVIDDSPGKPAAS